MGSLQRPRLFVAIRSYRNWAECRRCIVQLKLALAKCGYAGQTIHVIGDEAYPLKYAQKLRANAKQRLGSVHGQDAGEVVIHGLQPIRPPYSSQGYAASLAIRLAYQRMLQGEPWDMLLLVDDDYMIRSHHMKPFLGYMMGPMLADERVGIVGMRAGMLRLEVDGLRQRQCKLSPHMNGMLLIRKRMIDEVGGFLPLHTPLATTDFITRGLKVGWIYNICPLRYDKPNPKLPKAGSRGKGWVLMRLLRPGSQRRLQRLHDTEITAGLHSYGIRQDALLLRWIYARSRRYAQWDKAFIIKQDSYGSWTRGIIPKPHLSVTVSFRTGDRIRPWRYISSPAPLPLAPAYPPLDGRTTADSSLKRLVRSWKMSRRLMWRRPWLNPERFEFLDRRSKAASLRWISGPALDRLLQGGTLDLVAECRRYMKGGTESLIQS